MGKKQNGSHGSDKEEDSTTAVFNIDMHCEGCANKLRRCVRQIQGVERVRADWEANKLTVIGKFDASTLREKLADKTNKKIDIVSSEGKKEKKSKKPDEEAEDEKPKDKEIPVTTATLKVELHCQGCVERIYKVVSRTKGVEDMAMERQKDLVTVKGKMDVKALVHNLEDKLKRKVAVVVPKKDNDDGDGGDKNKSGGEVTQEDGGGETDGDRLDYMAVPAPGYEYGFGYGYGYGYGHGGFVGEHLPSSQMFSDENPNACTVM
ncbi:heavy metal-associated isoprenylated plant protein 3 [Cucurbita moschata]|uniref:Heavy metal-associated isoprenylated plant protein 3 n=1 Tax=Cucurbita moschata TaxID=3662 RepID=A0A6J1FUL5_CUCMO|nr:heavy metal-associated isoprenylated plant protein 3 [Cucurbita moschata]